VFGTLVSEARTDSMLRNEKLVINDFTCNYCKNINLEAAIYGDR
jgi:hypothetical protein